MSLKLVQLGLSGAAMFGPSGEVLQPSEVLRKRPILVERGSFRPVTKVNIDMINSAHQRFAIEPEVKADQVVEVMEITMRNLLAAGAIDLSDFLARADVLATAGKTVLISDYFAKDLRIYVYPLRDQTTGKLNTVENVEMPLDVRSLYHYLVERGRIKQLDNFDESVLHIFSRDVLRRIKDQDPSWEAMVPDEIAEVIKRRSFFGYREAEILARSSTSNRRAHTRRFS